MNVEQGDVVTVMTVAEVAAFLRLAESTVYKLAQDGELPGRKIGGTWRFSRKGLEDWLVQPAGGSALTHTSAAADSQPEEKRQ
jgi:excisionase family DNA binding protein